VMPYASRGSRRDGGCRSTQTLARRAAPSATRGRRPAYSALGVAIRSARGRRRPVGEGCHDPYVLREHVASFFRELRRLLGGKGFAYVWVPEWHSGGHGLHLHFAVGRFIGRHLIDQAWGRGFVHIKLLGDLPVGSGALGEARLAARYLSKYVGKAFEQERIPGLHRYEVAQGFKPLPVLVEGTTADAALDAAREVMDGRLPDRVWRSEDAFDWAGPPAVWASWPG
jgi:hypothetical protein